MQFGSLVLQKSLHLKPSICHVSPCEPVIWYLADLGKPCMFLQGQHSASLYMLGQHMVQTDGMMFNVSWFYLSVC